MSFENLDWEQVTRAAKEQLMVDLLRQRGYLEDAIAELKIDLKNNPALSERATYLIKNRIEGLRHARREVVYKCAQVKGELQ